MQAAGSLVCCALTSLCSEATRSQLRMGVHLTDTDTPGQTSGAPCLWAALSSARLVPLRRSAAPEAEGTANVHVTMRLMAAASPHLRPTNCRATGNDHGIYIYSHTVFIQRCCFAQIIMCFFTGRRLGICVFLGASQVLVKLISPPEKEEGPFASLVSSFFKVNRPVHFPSQGISGSIQLRLGKDGNQRWKNAGFPGASKYSPSGKIIDSVD